MVVFAFEQSSADTDAIGCEVWITQSADEEDELLAVVGPVDPGRGVLFSPEFAPSRAGRSASSRAGFAPTRCALSGGLSCRPARRFLTWCCSE